MIVTGIQIREAIRRHRVILDILQRGWSDRISAFPEEQASKTAEALLEYDSRIMSEEGAISALLAAQDYYNTMVYVDLDGATITLAEAVCLVGVYTRREARMRIASVPPRSGGYGLGYSGTRDKDAVTATLVLDVDKSLDEVSWSVAMASDARQVIASGNVQPVDIPWLSPVLFGE